MSVRKLLTRALLFMLLGVLFQIVYTLGFGLRPGAKAASLARP